VGLALAFHNEFNYYDYFLNASNHLETASLDAISFHFYAGPKSKDMS